MRSLFEAGSIDDNIGRGGTIFKGDERELCAIFLAKVDGKYVALGVLGSNVLDLHGVRLACWDFDRGLW